MLSALIAAILNPLEVIGTKEIFGKQKVNYRSFLILNMFFILLFSSVAYIFWGHIDFPNLTYTVALLMFLAVAASFFFNLLFYYALAGDKVSSVQPIGMMVPLVSVTMAAIIYPDERNWPIFLITIIAASALAFSRIEKRHLKPNKYTLAMMGFVFFVSAEALLAKSVLEVFSPVAYYTFRVGIASVLLALFIRPNLKGFGKKRTKSTALVSLFITVEYIAFFIAIDQIGIVKTSLIFLLGPVLTLLASRFHLKEKITMKAAFSDTIIVFCILASILVSK
ncbi:EamA family transporter [Patescibacteria group bacterium]|nr:EamA family transporter [Patescibacteria group bacterium]